LSKPTIPTRPLEADGRDHALVKELRLTVTAGPDRGASFRSTSDRAVVGTHRGADFVLGDKTISRFHCELSLRGGRVLLRDLDSRNGTKVAGLAIQAAWLDEDATLQLGGTKLRFTLASEERVRVPLHPEPRFGPMVGVSTAMRATFAALESAARAEATVLLLGETGTGKDVAAAAIHEASAREGGPFVIVDCGAIVGPLLESELFGHEKGAFTGAVRDRAGAFERASGGTLFLDEIGELEPELQPKLLRALEARRIRRVGGNDALPVDVRVIAATNRNLQGEVNAQRFRSDLYYRLAVLEIRLPPLRERPEDLPLLISEILAALGMGRSEAGRALLDDKSLAELSRHPWPGNVRELRNHVERALALRAPPPLDAPAELPPLPFTDGALPLRQAREGCVRVFEQQYLERLLRRHKNNVAAAARAAGIDRVHLHRLLSRSGLR
jgi:two-component system, NtrC family, response regulator GlrR